MSGDEHWEGYRPPASAAERQGEPSVVPPSPYDDLPVGIERLDGRRRSRGPGPWFVTGFVGVLVLVVGGLVAIGMTHRSHDTSIYTMISAHDYEHLVGDLRDGPGTKVSYVDVTTFDAQIDVPLGGDRTELYAFDDLQGLTAQERTAGDDPSFDLAELSAQEFLRMCAAAADVPDHDGDCTIRPAGRKDAAAGGWIRVTTERSAGDTIASVVYDRSGEAVRRR